MVTTILSKAFIENILVGACKNLKKDGDVYPALWIRLEGQKRHYILPLKLGNTPEQRYALMAQIGFMYRRKGERIAEALMVMGAYMLKVTAPDAHRFRPSQHPLRQEVIMLIGRNADNSRQATIYQTVDRDEQNNPVFGEVEGAVYPKDPKNQITFKGLIDYLFPETEQ